MKDSMNVEMIKTEKREYFKNWRRNNKDKVKIHNDRYWEKRAAKNQKVIQKGSDNHDIK